MKIESIKNVNITALFSSPLNHLLISQKDLLDLLKIEDEQKSFVEAPGLKVLMFPKKQKEFVFEGVRILVNDKSGASPENSDAVDNFQKIIKSNIIEQSKITAYGFNYDIIIAPENENFTIEDFVSSKISAIAEEIKSVGVNLIFDKNNVRYTLEIKPIDDKNKSFLAHFNAHIIRELPNFEELKKEIVNQFEEFKKVIEKI